MKPQDYKYWINRPKNDEQMDWRYDESNWLDGYLISVQHPHRIKILEALKDFGNISSILEIGCNVGPNFLRIKEVFPEVKLTGIDVNKLAIRKAKQTIFNVDFKVANYQSIPYPSKKFDIVLADAVLMYAGPKEIKKTMKELDRVCKKGIIIVDRFARSLSGEIRGHVWGRNYTKILEKLGFAVKTIKITKEIWPNSKNWVKYGKIFIAYRLQ